MGERKMPSTPEDTASNVEPLPSSLIDVSAPYLAAKRIVQHYYTLNGKKTLLFWQDEFHAFNGACYRVKPKRDIREELYRIGTTNFSKSPSKKVIDEVLDALKAYVNVSDNVMPPTLLDDDLTPIAIGTQLHFQNGTLDLRSRELLPPSPIRFVLQALPFHYEFDTPPPLVFLWFLHTCFDGDEASIRLLQEWFAYVLTGSTRLQKALLLWGPSRSGKGTILRVLVRLLGEMNVASPTLQSIGQPFGLQALIGKLLAIISDARIGGRADIHAIAENVLRITGEDYISVPRKFREDYTARLSCRLMLVSNELPRFSDSSGALASRFLILKTRRSFFGQEDTTLEERLIAELPSILNWALDGLESLDERGHFSQPSAGQDDLEDLTRLASPVGAFVEDECETGPDAQCERALLYQRYVEWSKENGNHHPLDAARFGQALGSVVDGLKSTRSRSNGLKRMYLGIQPRMEWGHG